MKKSILILVCIALIPCMSIGNNSASVEKVRPVFSKIIESEGLDSYRIPSFLIRFVLNFDSEGQQLIPIFSGARYIKIVTCEKKYEENDKIYNRLRNQLDLSSYKSLIDIIDKDSKLSIKALVDKDVIKEFVVLINDDGNFFAISMTGSMNLHKMAESVANLNTNLIIH